MLLYSSTTSKGPPHQKTSAYRPRLLNYLKTDMDFLHMFNLKMTVKKINFGGKSTFKILLLLIKIPVEVPAVFEPGTCRLVE